MTDKHWIHEKCNTNTPPKTVSVDTYTVGAERTIKSMNKDELQQVINKVWGICLEWKNPERFDDNPYDLASEIMSTIKDYQTYYHDSSLM